MTELRLPSGPAKQGHHHLFFGGKSLPSLGHAHLGLMLTPRTTKEEAEAPAVVINKHCTSVRRQFYAPHWKANDDYEILETSHGVSAGSVKP